MKNAITTMALLLMLASVSFSINCSAGYRDEFDVRVLDALMRPAPGVSVTVKFDRGTSFGEQYFTTPPKLTGANGMAHFELLNQGTTTRKIDCTIWITGKVGSFNVTNTSVATGHGPVYDLRMPIHQVVFFARNQNGYPLVNASVFFLGETRKTGSDGSVMFYSKKQNASYIASYEGGEEAGTVNVIGDIVPEIVIPVYNVTVFTQDDAGEPVAATIYYSGSSWESNGSIYITVYKRETEISASHGGITKTLSIKPEESASLAFYFDVNAPEIKNVQHTIINNRLRLMMDIEDRNPHSSGVDSASVQVKYRILPGGQWITVPAFVLSKKGSYAVDFPEVEDSRIVEFVIEAKDYGGNSVSESGQFVIESKQVENNTTNGQTGEKPQEFPWIYVLAGAIFIIVVFYIVKSLGKK